MDNIIQLDYSELVDSYWENLTIKLRGFSADSQFLEIWVPDTDHAKSIANLIEAAQISGCSDLDLILKQKTLETLDFENLYSIANGLGDIEFCKGDPNNVLKVRHLQEWSYFKDLHPIYRKGVREASKLKTQQIRSSKQNEISLQVVQEGITFSVLINKDNHVIEAASHDSSRDQIKLGILNKFCSIIIGCPIQDASEHATVNLEFVLRDRTQEHYMSGIILPKNADPMFFLPQTIIRNLLFIYQKEVGYKVSDNFYTPKSKSDWQSKPSTEQELIIKKCINEFCVQKKIPSNSISLMEVGKYTIVIDVDEELKLDKGKIYMDMESYIKDFVEESLSVYSLEKKDKNKSRREI